MNVLVTGGLGYLGAHVVEHFRRRGDSVTVLGRSKHPEYAEWLRGLRFVEADVADPASLARSCDGIDVVVHAAALNAQQAAEDPRSAVLVNGLGARNMLDEAARAGVGRFVYLSSIHVYGPLDGGRIDESTPPRPVSDYGISKLLGEGYCYRACATTPLSVAVLRPSNGYGAPLFPSADCWMLVINDFCRRAVERGEILLKTAGTQQRDFVALSDVVRAIDVVARREGPKEPLDAMVYDVGGRSSLTIRQLADLVASVYAEEFGREVPVRVAADAAPASPQSPMAYGIERISALGWEPVADMREEVRAILRFVARMHAARD
jgi:UDP-glucose 4-epimerase